MTKVSLESWADHTEHYLQGAAVLFLAAYAVPIIEPSVPQWVHTTCEWIIGATWVSFGIDYIARLCLAPHKAKWFWSNLPSLIILIIPILRPLRLLRLVTLLTVLNRSSMHSLRQRVAVYASGAVILLVFCGALAVTEAERGKPGSSIENFMDGLWWSAVTMTTVGYGDTYPVTHTGRLVAIALMVGGIALLGIVSGMLASWMVEQINDPDHHHHKKTEARIMSEELSRLAEMHAEGTLTDEEFSAAKARIIDSEPQLATAE